jgi:hypothetical protein
MEYFLPDLVLTTLIERLKGLCKEGNSQETFILIRSLIRMNQTEEVSDQFNVGSGERISADAS